MNINTRIYHTLDELHWKEDMEGEEEGDSDEEGWEECSNSDDDEEAPDLVEIKRKTKLNTKMNKQGCDENMEVEDEEGIYVYIYLIFVDTYIYIFI
jgi:hypothetical protein